MPDYRKLARDIASKYGINPRLFEKQIEQESGFNPNAKSSAGATGIAQLMPAHWKAVNPLDPEASLEYAAQLMSNYLDKYEGSYPLALAAYNAGPGSVQKYGGIPPFDETKQYIQSIMGPTVPAHQVGESTMEEKPESIPEIDNTSGIKDMQDWWEKWDPDAGDNGKWVELSGPPRMGIDIGPLNIGEEKNAKSAVHVQEVVFNDGEKWISYDEGKTWRYKNIDSGVAQQYKGAESRETTQWSVQTRKDGSKFLFNKLTGGVKPIVGLGPDSLPFVYKNPNDGSEKIIDLRNGAFIAWLSPPIPGYEPGLGVPPHRTVEDIESDRLNILKKKRDLEPEYKRIFQDAYDSTKELENMIALGQLSPAEGQKQIDLLRLNLQATLQGTTPWQMAQAKQTQSNWEETNRQSKLNARTNIAGSLMGNRAQMATTMGSSLLSQILGAYSGLRTSNNPPPMPDPLAMAQKYTDQNTGGSDMSELAKSVLMGALRGEQ